MKFLKNGKKFVLTFIVLTTMVFSSVKTASAIPVKEVNPLMSIVQPVQSIITAGNSIKTWVFDNYQWAFELAMETLRRKLLDMVVDQIVNWVQGGGQPKFITNWPGFLTDVADEAGGRFIQQIGLGRFCSAFKLQLSAMFIPIPRFSDRSSCTISQVGANLENFLKDFKSGGWIAWEQMVLRPENNIYGAYMMAWDQMDIEKAAAVKAAETEAQAGKGFLSVKRCLKTEQMCDEEGYCTSECVQSETVTPGTVVGDTLSTAVSSDILYLTGGAKAFSAYVAAISNAILNRMFSEGVGALRTVFSSDNNSGKSGGGGGGVSGNSTAAINCASLLGTSAYNDCVSAVQSGTDIKDFQKTSLKNVLAQDLSYQNQLLGAKQATSAILGQSAIILNNLEQCQNVPPLALLQVRSEITAISSDISKIQSDIIALQIKSQEVDAVNDANQIPAMFAKVYGVVNPAMTQSLVMAAQEETSTKQQNLSNYQSQLTQCQEYQQQNTQQQTDTGH